MHIVKEQMCYQSSSCAVIQPGARGLQKRDAKKAEERNLSQTRTLLKSLNKLLFSYRLKKNLLSNGFKYEVLYSEVI